MKQKKKKPLAPYVLCLVCLALMGVLRWAAPVGVFVHAPLSLLGLAPLGAGLALGVSAVARFMRVRTNYHPFKKPDKLVTDGVYRFGRNPMYLGLALILIGAWILLGAAVSGLAVVIFFVAVSDRFYIPPEEQILREKFGESYAQYCRAVRRWL